MKKSILFWLAFIFAILVAIYLSTRIIMLSLGTRGIADIKTISITTNNGKMDKSTIAAVLGIPGGTPTYQIELDDVLNRIMTIPDVNSARVQRMANGNLKIHVNLRNIIAYWTDMENFYPLSQDGTIINRPSLERPNGAVVFKGPIPKELIAITDALKHTPKIMNDADYLEWVASRRWNIIMKNGITIMLPEKNIANALNTLVGTDKKTNILNREITVLDLRDNERMFVKLN